jgi:hypothetical protein
MEAQDGMKHGPSNRLAMVATFLPAELLRTMGMSLDSMVDLTIG